MSRERGQALVEAMVAVPVGMLCAATLVDCSLIVRDRIAIAQAAGRAAEVRVAGGDARAAALQSLPGSLRSDARVDLHADRVVVRARTTARAATLLGDGASLTSTAFTDVAEVAR